MQIAQCFYMSNNFDPMNDTTTITTCNAGRERVNKLVSILVAANTSFTKKNTGSLVSLNIMISNDYQGKFVKSAIDLTGLKIDYIQ